MPTLVRLATRAACVSVLFVLAGCGSGVDTPAQTSEALRTRVGVLVDAANAGDPSSARTALTALRTDVSSALRLGSLSTERAAELSRLADDVEAALPGRPSPSVPPSKAPVEPSPQAPRTGGGQGADDAGADDAGAGDAGAGDAGAGDAGVRPDQGTADKGDPGKGKPDAGDQDKGGSGKRGGGGDGGNGEGDGDQGDD